VLLLALLSLTMGTLLAAVAGSITVLLVARVLQGLAGSIMPLAFGIVREQFPPQRVAGAIGGLSAMLAVGAATGIVLSGPIATNFGYAWLFWIPLMAIAPTAVTAWYFLRSASSARVPGRLDWLGSVLLSGWLVCLLLGVSEAPRWGWVSSGVVALFVAALVLLVLWLVAELRTDVPIVDVRLMGTPTVLRVNAVAFFSGAAMQSAFAFVTRFVQIPASTGFGLGVRASRAGLVILPWSLGAIVTGIVSGRLAYRYGSKRALVVGSLLSVAPFLYLTVENDAVSKVLLAMGVFGVGLGLVTAAMPAILVTAVPDTEIGASMGMNQNLRTIGGAIGAQIVAAVLASGIAANGYPTKSSYVTSFVVIAAACGVSAVAAALVPARSRVIARR
jgi:MFS family permease